MENKLPQNYVLGDAANAAVKMRYYCQGETATVNTESKTPISKSKNKWNVIQTTTKFLSQVLTSTYLQTKKTDPVFQQQREAP